ncbi:DUF6933 domain-containing protein [Celerinatantimonas sp. YJH-8]|uniref:DUF6933 domain-containing protein n=1 Tax=Celerinatantimonas sp. YJH-8 TaxID=3228714 RepID=UPI0038BFA6F5
MINLQFTEQLPYPLTPALPPQIPSESWCWQAHTISIASHECLLLVEHQTQYVMLFLDLNEQDYQAFEQVWLRRVMAEALTVTELSPNASERLQQAILDRRNEIILTQGSGIQYQNELADIVQGLQVLMQLYGQLPQGESEEFRWGVVLNQARQINGCSPYQLFADSCLFQLTENNKKYPRIVH